MISLSDKVNCETYSSNLLLRLVLSLRNWKFYFTIKLTTVQLTP